MNRRIALPATIVTDDDEVMRAGGARLPKTPREHAHAMVAMLRDQPGNTPDLLEQRR